MVVRVFAYSTSRCLCLSFFVPVSRVHLFSCVFMAAKVSIKSASRGMQREVGEENKGFQMLRRMGWQSGAIGQSQDGLVEPIDPLANRNVHTSPRRSGLGTGSEGLASRNRKERRASQRGMDSFVSSKELRARNKQPRDPSQQARACTRIFPFANFSSHRRSLIPKQIIDSSSRELSNLLTARFVKSNLSIAPAHTGKPTPKTR